MINLLPNTSKAQLKAARFNSLLMKLLLVTIISGVFLGGAILFTNESATGNTNQTSIDEQYNSYNQKATAIDNKISTAKSILVSQINFSEIILALTASLPEEVTLDSISLGTESINKSTAIEFNATGTKNFVSNSMNADPGFQTKYPSMFSNYKLISSQKNSKDNTISIKFSLNINYSKGL